MTPKEKHFWETASNSKLCFPDLVSNNSPAEGFPWASKQRNGTFIFSPFFSPFITSDSRSLIVQEGYIASQICWYKSKVTTQKLRNGCVWELIKNQIRLRSTAEVLKWRWEVKKNVFNVTCWQTSNREVFLIHSRKKRNTTWHFISSHSFMFFHF